MLIKLTKEIKILSSMCDNTAGLGIPNCVSLFTDLATAHANMLNVGADVLNKRNLAWIAAKTKLNVYNKPAMNSTVELATWPEKPEKIRFNRYYTITQNGKSMVEGKTEWVIIDKTTGRLQKPDGIYPEDCDYCKVLENIEPFMRTNENYSDGVLLGRYTVKSIDIDLYEHMNNAAYVRAIFGMFSCSQLENMDIQGFEIAYRIPCFEGDELELIIKEKDNGYSIGILNSAGKTAVTAYIITNNKAYTR